MEIRGAASAEAVGTQLLGAKVDGVLPFGGLSPSAGVGLEAGSVFPWAKGRLAAALDVDFAAPTGSKSGAPRVPNASYDWHLTEHELAFMPVAMYRLTSLGQRPATLFQPNT